jgi:hypothetical protein
MKYKNVYTAHFIMPNGNFGAQPVKGNTLAQAKERFKKKFKTRGKKRYQLLDFKKDYAGQKHLINPI